MPTKADIFPLHSFFSKLIIFFPNLKIALRVVADRTYLRGLGAYYDMAAVPALPEPDVALLEYYFL